jgi:2-polyprenyl-6-methoxyphenol hydroxylase-like FAD-dependent oxidoreductase
VLNTAPVGVRRREIIIVGAGPAGSATALGLVARDPALAREVLVL